MKNKKRNNSEDAFFASWFRQMGYAIKNLLSHIKQNLLSYFLTCFVIAITISLPATSYVLWKNSDIAAKEWQPSPNLTIYLTPATTKAQAETLMAQIQQQAGIWKVIYMSKEEALTEFSEWSGFGASFDLLESNPLPNLIIIEPESQYDQAQIEALRQMLQNDPAIDEVKFDDSWITRLIALSDLIKWLALSLSVLMICALLLVIGNTVRLSIFARKQSIKVMQRLGATSAFIFRPFLYYGLVIGGFSGLLGILLTQLITYQIRQVILKTASIFDLPLNLEGLNGFDALMLFYLCVFLGWISAYFTTRHYLNKNQR